MASLFFGIISVFLSSLCGTYYKKAFDDAKGLSVPLFKLFADIFGLFVVTGLFTFYGFEYNLIDNPIHVLIIIAILSSAMLRAFNKGYILKNVKLSELLPYDNLDKIFIVLLGYTIFAGTSNSVSLTTFIITLLTIIIISGFNIFGNKIKINKAIFLHIFNKFIAALEIIGIGYILLTYTSVTFAICNGLFGLTIYTLIILISKKSFKPLITQSKNFYKSRSLGFITGWSGYLINLYIIQASGVIIASLLGFMGIIFGILSMKFILKDTPNKNQIFLSIIIIFMIGIGYYFK